MVCKYCDNSDVTVDDLEGVDSCSNTSPCKSCVELVNLENAIARHKMKRCELKRNINRIHSPFNRIIPPDIIATISRFANTDFTIIGRLPAAILLSSVCSDWRRTVVGTPELWSSIKIDLPSISKTSDRVSKLLRLATFIDEWLARSGQLPLNISLCSGDESPSKSDLLTPEAYRPIFKILNQYSSRWHSLNISIPNILLPFLQPDCLPLLEQLRITSSKSHPRHIITFPPAPCLNTVEIKPFMNYRFSLSPNIGFQWNTVTHVSAETITRRNCLALLLQNPQLVHCTFHKVFHDENPFLDPPILSRLTYLSLHHNFDTSQVLDNIKLPCLETLVLFNITFIPVTALLERSACSLRTLSLLNWHLQKPEKLMPLLQFLSPSLTKLSISRKPSTIRGTQYYLSILTRVYTSQSEVVGNDFLPHLEVFEYREESPSTLESSMLLSSHLLPSRNYTTPSTSISLRSVFISMASIIDKEIPYLISVVLQHLEKAGILIYTWGYYILWAWTMHFLNAETWITLASPPSLVFPHSLVFIKSYSDSD